MKCVEFCIQMSTDKSITINISNDSIQCIDWQSTIAKVYFVCVFFCSSSCEKMSLKCNAISITKLKILECYQFNWLYALAFLIFIKGRWQWQGRRIQAREIQIKPENINCRRIRLMQFKRFGWYFYFCMSFWIKLGTKFFENATKLNWITYLDIGISSFHESEVA